MRGVARIKIQEAPRDPDQSTNNPDNLRAIKARRSLPEHHSSSFHCSTRIREQSTSGSFSVLPDESLAEMNLVPVSSCCVLLAMWLLSAQGETVPEVANGHRRLRSRPHLRGYAIEELFGEDEDLLDNIKRQQFDDYGHMRFGKRENLDDYGHMRFGRGHH